MYSGLTPMPSGRLPRLGRRSARPRSARRGARGQPSGTCVKSGIVIARPPARSRRCAQGGEGVARRRRRCRPPRRSATLPASSTVVAPAARSAAATRRRARRRARRWSRGTATGRADLRERGHHVGGGLGGPGLDGLDPAGLQQVAGEAGPRGVGGERARAWRGTRAAGCRSRRARRRTGRGGPRRPRRAGTRAARRGAARCGSGSRSTGFSARSGNSLTPVIGALRVAAARSRRSRTAAIRSAEQPGRERARPRRPRASISWKNAQAARASPSVSDSTYQEPPAGIDHPGQVRLLDEQRLGVARDPPGERRRRHRARRRTGRR